MTLVSRLLLVPALALIGLGAEGLYHARRGREKVAVDCFDLTRDPPPSHRLLVTGCEIDFVGSGYRESGGRIQELFLPARPAGRSIAAPLVVATREPGALALAEKEFGGGRTVPPERSIAVMQSVAARIKVTTAIDGLARAGTIEQMRARRILGGLAGPIASNAQLIDLGGSPDNRTPLLALGAGLLLALLPFALGRRAIASLPHAEPSSDPVESAPPPPVRSTPPSRPTVSLPRLLLLSLDPAAGPEAIEAAPALGARRDVVAILRGVIPDLELDDRGHVLSRSDSLRIDLGADDPVPTAVVDARGEAGAALVKEVLLMTGWRAFAPKTGLFVTIDDLTAIGELAAD